MKCFQFCIFLGIVRPLKPLHEFLNFSHTGLKDIKLSVNQAWLATISGDVGRGAQADTDGLFGLFDFLPDAKDAFLYALTLWSERVLIAVGFEISAEPVELGFQL